MTEITTTTNGGSPPQIIRMDLSGPHYVQTELIEPSHGAASVLSTIYEFWEGGEEHKVTACFEWIDDQDPEEEAYWAGYLKEFPGCVTDGRCLISTAMHLRDAMFDYFEALREQGIDPWDK